MPNLADDFELKFDGPPVRALSGAPAETVVASLNALQRIVYIVAMRAEGRALSERLKPTAKVRRNYAVICKASEEGSHIQPFSISTLSGASTTDTAVIAEKVLRSLKAFDSGEEWQVQEALPNARERWFVAKAARGLIPPEESGIEVMVRAGRYGRFAFKADRARRLIEKYERTAPPETDEETVVGRLGFVDFDHTIFSVKPARQPTIRLGYPLQLETWIEANKRRRLQLTGKPKYNERGDVSTFTEIVTVVEVEPTLEAVSEFDLDGRTIVAQRPLSLPVVVDWPDRLFCLKDENLGIHVVSPEYETLRQELLDELRLLWHSYAEEDEAVLNPGAKAIKRELLNFFQVSSRDPRQGRRSLIATAQGIPKG